MCTLPPVLQLPLSYTYACSASHVIAVEIDGEVMFDEYSPSNLFDFNDKVLRDEIGIHDPVSVVQSNSCAPLHFSNYTTCLHRCIASASCAKSSTATFSRSTTRSLSRTRRTR